MLSLPHAAVGASIASLIPIPLISIPLSFLSHFIADYLPHWNPHLDTELKKHGGLTPLTQFVIATDFFIALIFIAVLSLQQPSQIQTVNIALSSLAAIAPDLVEAPHYFLNLKLPLVDRLIHHQRHNQNHVAFLPGFLVQLFIFSVCLLVLFR